MSSHEELERRVQRLEDQLSILNVFGAYAHAIDHGDPIAWSESFTVDGSFTVTDGDGNVTEKIEGRDALFAFSSSHSHAPERWHRHLNAVPVVKIDDDRAEATSYIVLVGADEGEDEPQVAAFGRYRDQLVRDTDGAWRFESRVVDLPVIGTRGMPEVHPERAETAAAARAAGDA